MTSTFLVFFYPWRKKSRKGDGTTEYVNQLNANEKHDGSETFIFFPLWSVMSVQAMLIQTAKYDVAVTQTRPPGPNAHSHTQLLLLWIFLSLFLLFLASPAPNPFLLFTPFSFLLVSPLSFFLLYPFICPSSAYHSHFLFSLHSFIHFPHCISPVSHFILLGIPPSVVRLVNMQEQKRRQKKPHSQSS